MHSWRFCPLWDRHMDRQLATRVGFAAISRRPKSGRPQFTPNFNIALLQIKASDSRSGYYAWARVVD